MNKYSVGKVTDMIEQINDQLLIKTDQSSIKEVDDHSHIKVDNFTSVQVYNPTKETKSL